MAVNPPVTDPETKTATHRRAPVAQVAVAVTVLLWSSAFVAIRVGVRHYGVLGLTAGRLLVASAALGGFAAWFMRRLPPRRVAVRLALSGLAGMTGYQALLNAGEVRVTAATASVIIATAPVMSAVLAVAFLAERASPTLWTGSAVAFGGVLISALGADASALRVEPAALLVLAAALAHAAYFVLIKPLLRRHSALEVTAWATWFGAAASTPFVPTLADRAATAPWEAHVAVLFLGVGASALGFFTWSVALRHLSVSVAAAYLYAVPPTTLVLGWLLLGEDPTIPVVVGGLVTLGGVWVVHRGHGAVAEAPRADIQRS